ncbi:MAG TPA: 50S ribosomal protein L17, partial [Vicinamibacteria bacterium]|nr:50S ribosomal protein L17 [Vicinamibacteria bacterium]
MRHRSAHRKLGRKTEHRMSLLRNLAASLISHGRIRTTEAK